MINGLEMPQAQVLELLRRQPLDRHERAQLAPRLANPSSRPWQLRLDADVVELRRVSRDRFWVELTLAWPG